MTGHDKVLNLNFRGVGWMFRLKFCWHLLFRDAVTLSGVLIEIERQ